MLRLADLDNAGFFDIERELSVKPPEAIPAGSNWWTLLP
jgi:hypothetical protein